MPNINLKLFASLKRFMPQGHLNGEVAMEIPDGKPIEHILSDLNVPLEQCHLVIVNGVFIPREKRASTPMTEGDTLAVWPPVAGG